jgi:hypothetical protein
MLSEAVLGVTSLGADTTGANVVRLRVAFPITTARLTTGANVVIERASLPIVTRRGVLTVGANVVSESVAVFGVTRSADGRRECS